MRERYNPAASYDAGTWAWACAIPLDELPSYDLGISLDAPTAKFADAKIEREFQADMAARSVEVQP